MNADQLKKFEERYGAMPPSQTMEHHACGITMQPNNTFAVAIYKSNLAIYSDACQDEAKRAEGLVKALETARENLANWGTYVSPYFQAKHGLQADLNAIDAALAAYKGESK